MLLVAHVRGEWHEKIPAVVHRDGTARIQTVTGELSSRYHALLEAVKRKAGLSLLLNTSFNKRGMPIVETPRDAIALFVETALDALIIEDFLVLKKAQTVVPEQTIEFAALFHKVCRLASNDAERPRSLGILRFVITGTEQAWTLNFSGSPCVSQTSAFPPDHTIVCTAGAIRQMTDDPGCLLQLFESGQVHVPGLGLESSQGETLLTVWAKVIYLVQLIRSD